MTTEKHALVLGGTGAVGQQVVQALTAQGVKVVFTHHSRGKEAELLAAETGSTTHRLDLVDERAQQAFFDGLAVDPTIFIHCAGVSRQARLQEIELAEWHRAVAINGASAFLAAKHLAPRMARRGGGDLVFVGGLDRTQMLPMPIHYAASQGMLHGLVMALGKELGASNIRVNMVALGLLHEGMSAQADAKSLEAWKTFSALRRTGTAQEAASAIVWFALHNTFMTGRVLPVNGGI